MAKKLTGEELRKIEQHLIEFLKTDIGPILKNASGTKFDSYDEKVNDVDLVTVVDKKVETLIRKFAEENYPEIKFIGEESLSKDERFDLEDPTFIVDPIDGTTNFIHGFPFSCTSIGVAQGGKPVIGCVYNPHLNQLFHASLGNGAYLNDEPINIEKRTLSLKKSIIGFEGGSEREDGKGTNFTKKFDTYRKLLSDRGAFIHGFRSLGSAAMNICYVSIGYMDAYWEGGCWAWDVCAGWCILNEAGGKIVGGNPGQWNIPINNRSYLAVRGGLVDDDEQEKFIQDFWGFVEGALKY